MATGQKRADAKAEARARGESLFAFSDGKIHAYESRENYQKIVMRFIDWCRDAHNVRDLARIDEQADELASMYLVERMSQGKSAWTLQTERSALRMFFQNCLLADRVQLPTRRREDITRSRRPAARDRHFQPEHWQPLIRFCLACGLRREELRDLCVCDVSHRSSDGQLVVRVVKGKGGKRREVSVFPAGSSMCSRWWRGATRTSMCLIACPATATFIAIAGNLRRICMSCSPGNRCRRKDGSTRGT